MATRTVRLDEETEEVLDGIRRETGLSVSAALKKGVLALAKDVSRQASRSAYEIYQQLDLGPGGDAISPSTETRQGVRKALRKKWNR